MTRKIYLALLAIQQQDGNLNEKRLPPGPQRSYIDLHTQTPERRTRRRTDTRSLVRRPKQHAWNVLPSRAAPRSEEPTSEATFGVQICAVSDLFGEMTRALYQ